MGNNNGKYTIAQSVIDSFNTSNTNVIVSTVIKQAQIASANIGLIQNTTISNITTTGTGNTTIDAMTQNQNAKLSFSSVKASNVVSDSTINIVTNTLDKLSDMDHQVLSDIITSAQSKNKTLFTTPIDQVLEMSTRTNTTDLPPTIYTSFRNVITNTLTNTLTVDSISICLAKIIANQTININNISVEGTLNIGTISQSQAVTLLASCTQLNNTITNSTNNVLTTLGVTVADDTQNAGTNTSSNTTATPVDNSKTTDTSTTPIISTTQTASTTSDTTNNQYIYITICIICLLICCCMIALLLFSSYLIFM